MQRWSILQLTTLHMIKTYSSYSGESTMLVIIDRIPVLLDALKGSCPLNMKFVCWLVA